MGLVSILSISHLCYFGGISLLGKYTTKKHPKTGVRMIQNNPLCKCISDKAGPSCEAVREKHVWIIFHKVILSRVSRQESVYSDYVFSSSCRFIVTPVGIWEGFILHFVKHSNKEKNQKKVSDKKSSDLFLPRKKGENNLSLIHNMQISLIRKDFLRVILFFLGDGL